MIEVKNVTKLFERSKSLDDVSITFNKGDIVAIMGPNGAGKTTLIRSILGYYHISSGNISVNGLDPIENREDVLTQVSFVPQLPPPIKLSVRELLQYVSKSSNISIEKIEDYANKMDLDLNNNRRKSFFKLSGGMKQKLLIAIAAAKNSDIMIFDEPTANLDPKARESFYKILDGKIKDKVVLFISHREDEIKHLINRKIYMDLGKVVEDESC